MNEFDERISELEREVAQASQELGEKNKYSNIFSLPLIAGVATPFALAAILWGVKPGFVTKKTGEKKSIDAKKLLQWTIIFSLVVWIGLYLYTYCQDTGSSPLAWFRSS